MSKQRFSTNPVGMMEEIYLVAESQGLVREGIEYEEKKSDRIPYWNDTVSGRKFRLLEEVQELEVSDDDFDRWANSALFREKLPDTLEDFSKLIESLRAIQPEKEQKPKYSRKSKNR